MVRFTHPQKRRLGCGQTQRVALGATEVGIIRFQFFWSSVKCVLLCTKAALVGITSAWSRLEGGVYNTTLQKRTLKIHPPIISNKQLGTAQIIWRNLLGKSTLLQLRTCKLLLFVVVLYGVFFEFLRSLKSSPQICVRALGHLDWG